MTLQAAITRVNNYLDRNPWAKPRTNRRLRAVKYFLKNWSKFKVITSEFNQKFSGDSDREPENDLEDYTFKTYYRILQQFEIPLRYLSFPVQQRIARDFPEGYIRALGYTVSGAGSDTEKRCPRALSRTRL